MISVRFVSTKQQSLPPWNTCIQSHNWHCPTRSGALSCTDSPALRPAAHKAQLSPGAQEINCSIIQLKLCLLWKSFQGRVLYFFPHHEVVGMLWWEINRFRTADYSYQKILKNSRNLNDQIIFSGKISLCVEHIYSGYFLLSYCLQRDFQVRAGFFVWGFYWGESSPLVLGTRHTQSPLPTPQLHFSTSPSPFSPQLTEYLRSDMLTSTPVDLFRFSSWDTTTCSSFVRWQSSSNMSVPKLTALQGKAALSPSGALCSSKPKTFHKATPLQGLGMLYWCKESSQSCCKARSKQESSQSCCSWSWCKNKHHLWKQRWEFWLCLPQDLGSSTCGLQPASPGLRKLLLKDWVRIWSGVFRSSSTSAHCRKWGFEKRNWICG